jgi:hypothetical protein
MKKGRNRVCPVCGKICLPRGIGGHMRLAHRLAVKTLVKQESDIHNKVSHDVSDLRGDIPSGVSDMAFDIRDVRRKIIDVSGVGGMERDQSVNAQEKMSIEIVRTGTEPDVFPVADTLVEKIPEVAGKDLSECKRPDGTHLYTDSDLQILMSLLIKHTYDPGSEVILFNEFTYMDLIADFERRFKCRFDDVRKANKYGKISVEMGTTPCEHWRFANNYGTLRYSR